MTRIYIAGPLFNTHERWYLEQLAAALEGAGYATFLPHRDAGLVDFSVPGAQARIFRADVAALNTCDLGVALLTGADHDSGTSAELGYLFAQGKPCFGISDDFRARNNLIWGLCGEGSRIAKDIPGLLALLEAAKVADELRGQPGALAPALQAQVQAIVQRRSAEFVAAGLIQAASLQTVIWTLDAVIEEAEDADDATNDNSRVRDLTIIRDLLGLLPWQTDSDDAVAS